MKKAILIAVAAAFLTAPATAAPKKEGASCPSQSFWLLWLPRPCR